MSDGERFVPANGEASDVEESRGLDHHRQYFILRSDVASESHWELVGAVEARNATHACREAAVGFGFDEGDEVVAIAESYWQPRILEVKQVQQVTFR